MTYDEFIEEVVLSKQTNQKIKEERVEDEGFFDTTQEREDINKELDK